MRLIFHVDMDAFFVSVEERFDPSLEGKPVIVGGAPHQRGVVAAASYAARKYGVHSAMPLRTAYQLCPQAIFLPGHPERYREYSEKVHAVLCQFSPLVEMASVDEAYLDMTGTERLYGPPLKAAHRLHEAVREATGLRCSIGASRSRMVSKVASDQAKPNGVLWVVPGCEAAFLQPLAIRRIPGVGPATERALHELGVRTVGDLGRLPVALLEQRLGKWGLALAGKAQGHDAGAWFDAPVGEEQDPKSLSHEHTFEEDTADEELVESTLALLAGKVARRLREHDLYARTVQLKLRRADFSTITRARTLGEATQLERDLFQVVRQLWRAHWKLGEKVRLVGVQASQLAPAQGQLSLLEAEDAKRWRRALTAVDHLRDKFGEDAVTMAKAMRGRYREKAHENPVGLPGKGVKKDPRGGRGQ